MGIKEMYKTEILQDTAGKYVGCAVIRANDIVAASTKALNSADDAKEAISATIQRLWVGNPEK